MKPCSHQYSFDQTQTAGRIGRYHKTKRPNNKKTNLYLLTEKGLALTPILVELALWSDNYLRDVHPTIQMEKEWNSYGKTK
jgi:DNA-binding HxlR family transcriptional regulator